MNPTKDPWDYTVDEVVSVIRTYDATHLERLGSSIPDLGQLALHLRKNHVDGATLLLDVTNDVLKQDFEIQSLGLRSMLLQAIEHLRLQSIKYSRRQSKSTPRKPTEIIDLTSPPRATPSAVTVPHDAKIKKGQRFPSPSRILHRRRAFKRTAKPKLTSFIDLTSPTKPRAPRRIRLASTSKLEKTPDVDEDIDSFSFVQHSPSLPSSLLQQLASHKTVKGQLYRGQLYGEQEALGWDKFLYTNPAVDVERDPGMLIDDIGENVCEDDALSSDNSDDDSVTSDQPRTRGLSFEEIVSVLDAAIVEYQTKWENNKLPVLQRSAHKLFQQSRGRNQARLIARDRAQLERFRLNLAKLRNQIQSDDWTSLVALKLVCASLEVTVQNIAEYEYKISVYTSNAPPTSAITGAPLAQDTPPADAVEIGHGLPLEDRPIMSIADALNVPFGNLRHRYDPQGMIFKIVLNLDLGVSARLAELLGQFSFDQCTCFVKLFFEQYLSWDLQSPPRVESIRSIQIHPEHNRAIAVTSSLFLAFLECTEQYHMSPVRPSAKSVNRALGYLDRYASTFLHCLGRVVDQMQALMVLPWDGLVNNCVEIVVSHARLSQVRHVIRIHSGIYLAMKQHQQDGVQFLWREIILSNIAGEDSGCLLAHTMGLGKTMQAITFVVALLLVASEPRLAVQLPSRLCEASRKVRVLIVVPAGLICNWMDELNHWIPPWLWQDFLMATFEDSTRKEDHVGYVKAWSESGGILLMSYDLLASYTKQRWQSLGIWDIISSATDLVIADEAHKFKNPTTSYSKAMHKLETPYRMALTGSPLSNHLGEYYAILKWVAPSTVQKLGDFKREYQEPIEQGLKGDGGEKYHAIALELLNELDSRIAGKVQRRGEQCLAEALPPKREFVITVKPLDSQRHVYNQLQEAQQAFNSGRLLGVLSLLTVLVFHLGLYRSKLERVQIQTPPADAPQVQAPSIDEDMDSSGDALVFNESFGAFRAAQLESLRTLAPPDANYPKPSIILGLIAACLEQGDSVVVFSHWHLILDWLQTALRPYGSIVDRLDGNTKPAERQLLSQKLSTRQIRVLLSTTRAGGVGLNLQGANRVILADLTFNPVHEMQAIARAWRMGQTKPVTCYSIVTAGSFEAVLHAQARYKRKLALRVVDGVESERSASAWESLMGPLGEVSGGESATSAMDGVRGVDAVLDKVLDKGEIARAVVGVEETTDRFVTEVD